MKIASEAEHRALAYVAAVERHGTQIALWALEAYCEPHASPLLRMLGSYQLGGAESPAARMLRVGWIAMKPRSKHFVQMTNLGKIVLRELDIEEASSGELSEAVVVRPDDPLGYAKLIARIASYEDALLVDPYLEIEALAIVANGTSIGRVLTSKKDQARVAAIIAAAQTDALPNTIDIRFSSELHDRYVIPPTGPIEHLGTSLNGASKHVSVSTPLREPVASEIRRLMEGIWERAEKMKIPKAKGARIAAGLAAGAGVTATDSVDGADALAADIAPTADPGSARED